MTDTPSAIKAAMEAGGPGEAERLLPLVYDELRRLARAHMRREAPGNSLQATALVHEAYLRVLGPQGKGADGWNGKAHFFGAAAQAMRRILVDRARNRGAIKRGGQYVRLKLFELDKLSVDEVPPELLDLDAALTRLAEANPQQAELVSLRFFGGLSLKEVAAVMDISIGTADRHWAFARVWLLAAMEGEL